MRSQPRAMLAARARRDAADLGDHRLWQAVQREAHVADVAHGVPLVRALPPAVGPAAAQVGARAERPTGAREHDDAVVACPAMSRNVASSSSHIASLMAFFFSGRFEGDGDDATFDPLDLDRLHAAGRYSRG